MIRLKNRNEFLITHPITAIGLSPTSLASTAVPIWQPVADKAVLYAMPAPFNLKVMGAVIAIAAIGVKGTNNAVVETYTVRNGGRLLAGTTALTGGMVAMDLAAAPDVIPVEGARIFAGHVSPAPLIRIGEFLIWEFDTTGASTDETRPKVVPVGIIVRAEGNMDPLGIGNDGLA